MAENFKIILVNLKILFYYRVKGRLRDENPEKCPE